MAAVTGRRIAEVIGWVGALGVGAVLITQLVGWDGTPVVATLQALTPIGLALAILVTVVASLGRSWWLTIVSSIVVLGALVLAVPIAFHGDDRVPAPDADGVSIASINLLFSNPVVDDVADDLMARSPDVVAFSEYTPEHRRTLDAHPLAARYPHRIDLDESFGSGMAVWSVFPIVDRGPDIGTGRGIDVTVAGPDGPLRVIAVHPRTPISDFDSWQDALRSIGDSALGSATPTVVVGDFNASFWHPGFRDLLVRGLTDAHIAAGRGWSTSWPTDEPIPAFVRLDHALTDDRLTVTGLVDFEPPGSDHRAFVVTVAPVDVNPQE